MVSGSLSCANVCRKATRLYIHSIFKMQTKKKEEKRKPKLQKETSGKGSIYYEKGNSSEKRTGFDRRGLVQL